MRSKLEEAEQRLYASFNWRCAALCCEHNPPSEVL